MLEYRQQEEFYVDDEFGEIPKGWALKKFIRCFEFFPTASYSREQLSEKGDSCYIHYGDIHTKFDGFIDFKKDKLPFVDKTMASRFTKLKEGDLIIADASEDYDGVGKAVEVLNIENVEAIAGLHTLHLRAIDDCLVNGFKAYVLNNGVVRNKILRSATGIKVYSISKSSLKNILIPIPPPIEQRTIASILAKVDEAIAATKNSIAKAERLKKSLMQNLLTGKLKPDGTWRKEDDFYKDEKVGNVPVGWKVEKLKKVLKLKNGKGNPTNNLKSKPEDNFNIPVYGGNGITGFFDTPFLTQSTLIIGRVGEYCGSVYKTPEKCWVTDNALWVSEIFEQAFDLDYWFFSLTYKKLNQYGDATGQPKITQSGIGNLKVFYPENEVEQKEIAQKIIEVETILHSKHTKVKKLERLKKALMQNLLTGKVRVKVPKEATIK